VSFKKKFKPPPVSFIMSVTIHK